MTITIPGLFGLIRDKEDEVCVLGGGGGMYVREECEYVGLKDK